MVDVSKGLLVVSDKVGHFLAVGQRAHFFGKEAKHVYRPCGVDKEVGRVLGTIDGLLKQKLACGKAFGDAV